MRLADLLHPQGIKVLATVTAKKRLFQELGELAAATLSLDSGEVVEALVDREAMGGTGVGQGVAFPHARLPGLARAWGLFLRLERPIDFDAVDRQPVDLFFGLLAPAGSGVEHLKALALASRTMRDPAICQKLRANSDPAALYAILTEGPASRAA
jgi:nitrogen PTS system EIIA component